MKAERSVKRIMFDRSEASPGKTLYVSVPKLNADEIFVLGSLSLLFDIDLAGGHANNFLVQNVTRNLVERLVVKYAGTVLPGTVGYEIFKIWEDLFLSLEERDNMLLEGIQTEKLCKIRAGAGDKATTGVDIENKLETIYKKKYRIRLDHQILSDDGVFFPQALFNDLVFELTLAPANQMVNGLDTTKLKWKKIQLEYEMIRSKSLASEAQSIYSAGNEFLYDHVQRTEVVRFHKNNHTRLNIKLNPQRRSLKGILFLFVYRYVAGARDSEKNPDLTKVIVTVNGSPNRVCNNGIGTNDVWEASRFFVKEKNKTQHMNLTKFYTGNRFGLLIDLRSRPDHSMHGSGRRLLNTKEEVQLEIERDSSGSGNVNCHVFVISDSQMNIQGQQLDSVQY